MTLAEKANDSAGQLAANALDLLRVAAGMRGNQQQSFITGDWTGNQRMIG
jgi:hypothetical protein